MLHRYFIKISFDGTRYNGWQVQKNSAETIQQKINEGLSKLLVEKIEVYGCCRTDAGVHAKELFAHFDSSKNLIPPAGHTLLSLNNRAKSVAPMAIGGEYTSGVRAEVDWLHKFNSVLPTDISIDGIYSVGDDASARYDASARTYQYFINSKRNPFLVNRSYYYYSELDIALMNRAAKILIKNKDFSSFSKVNTQVKTNICKISKAEWVSTEDGYMFTIRSDRFLRGMVRMIVGTMILIGKHKLSISDLKKILDSKDCRNAGVSVPACGLHLAKVEYPQKIFKK
ncbi:MAG: tRNA pseudouridine(38-40) synthase TruA [Bacteroidetes bacterium]|nr:MAG: tRNA pseudouridine(38-40) synthase TruA [Bacteroidota bacterium]